MSKTKIRTAGGAHDGAGRISTTGRHLGWRYRALARVPPVRGAAARGDRGGRVGPGGRAASRCAAGEGSGGCARTSGSRRLRRGPADCGGRRRGQARHVVVGRRTVAELADAGRERRRPGADRRLAGDDGVLWGNARTNNRDKPYSAKVLG